MIWNAITLKIFIKQVKSCSNFVIWKIVRSWKRIKKTDNSYFDRSFLCKISILWPILIHIFARSTSTFTVKHTYRNISRLIASSFSFFWARYWASYIFIIQANWKLCICITGCNGGYVQVHSRKTSLFVASASSILSKQLSPNIRRISWGKPPSCKVEIWILPIIINVQNKSIPVTLFEVDIVIRSSLKKNIVRLCPPSE